MLANKADNCYNSKWRLSAYCDFFEGETVRDILLDIRQKLKDSAYSNEEHVRLSLVCRILHRLGWNLWNPQEVNSEFKVLPQEDSSRVDLALFLTPYLPEVFIEIKSVGKLTGNIGKIEHQLRDYNRNNTALFTIITDGQNWRFYYSQTGGEFSQKRFKTLDILEDDIDGLVSSFEMFLSKEKVGNGNAELEAQKYLQLSRKQRVMEDVLPEAKRLVNEPPFPTLPQAVVNLAKDAGQTVSVEEASRFIKESANRDIPQGTITNRPISKPITIPIKPKIYRSLGRKGYEQLSDYIFPVIHMMRNGLSHQEAFKKRATDLKVRYNTVSAQCTRTLGITTPVFVQFVSNGGIVGHLKKRYPYRKEEIDRELAGIKQLEIDHQIAGVRQTKISHELARVRQLEPDRQWEVSLSHFRKAEGFLNKNKFEEAASEAMRAFHVGAAAVKALSEELGLTDLATIADNTINDCAERMMPEYGGKHYTPKEIVRWVRKTLRRLSEETPLDNKFKSLE